jgi:PKD repeat protein
MKNLLKLAALFICLLPPVSGYASGLRAVCTAETQVVLGEPVHFDGTHSAAEPGSRIVAWIWDYDNMDGVEGNSQGEKQLFYYNQVGGYTATLTVVDDHGKLDKTFHRVEVVSPGQWGPALVDRFEGGRTGVSAKSDALFTFYCQGSIQWYFRLDNVANLPLRIKIFGYGPERKIPISVTPYDDDQSFDPNFIPYVNYDFSNPHWERLMEAKIEYDPKNCAVTIQHRFAKSPVYLAWAPPYLNSDLDLFLHNLPESRFWRKEVLGKSVEGREIKMVTVTDSGIPDSKKTVVWITGQQHGYEMVGGPICEGIIHSLLGEKNRDDLLREFIFKLVPIVNPDAMAHGGFRYNMHDVDLNRNWDEQANGYQDRTLPEPEVACVQAAMRRWVEQGNGLDFYLDMHCHTAISEGLWIYPSDATLAGPLLFQKEMRFAKEFLNRNFQYSIEVQATNPGLAPRYIATEYAKRLGVLSFYSENPLLAIRTAKGERLLTTPELYRSIGVDLKNSICDYFQDHSH